MEARIKAERADRRQKRLSAALWYAKRAPHGLLALAAFAGFSVLLGDSPKAFLVAAASLYFLLVSIHRPEFATEDSYWLWMPAVITFGVSVCCVLNRVSQGSFKGIIAEWAGHLGFWFGIGLVHYGTQLVLEGRRARKSTKQLARVESEASKSDDKIR